MCADDFVPTPYIYFPAYGLWRIAGAPGWAAEGPDLDYTGPITVEMLEHRRLAVTDPYTGRTINRVINVPYFYNAFFFPEYGRWGYVNRHGYFILLNI